jgi:hypothetical protein
MRRGFDLLKRAPQAIRSESPGFAGSRGGVGGREMLNDPISLLLFDLFWWIRRYGPRNRLTHCPGHGGAGRFVAGHPSSR